MSVAASVSLLMYGVFTIHHLLPPEPWCPSFSEHCNVSEPVSEQLHGPPVSSGYCHQGSVAAIDFSPSKAELATASRLHAARPACCPAEISLPMAERSPVLVSCQKSS